MKPKPNLRYEVEVNKERNEQILTLAGKLVGSTECYEMLEETRDRVQEGLVFTVLDMSEVRMINSNGLGILASLITSTKRQNGRLILVGLNDRSRRVLEFMNLHQFAMICDNLEQARAAEA